MRMIRALGLSLLATLCIACVSIPAAAPTVAPVPPIEAVVLHPIFDTWFLTLEHWEGQNSELGDALAVDCMVAELVEEEGRTWLRMHQGNGARNEDWFGWRREVLAPLSGEVVRVHVNGTVNEPGTMVPGIASHVVLRTDDGTHVAVIHLREMRVKEGDRVEAGEVLGLVGNNGNSRNPHIHVGAWRDGVPLQIRFDLREMGRLRARAAAKNSDL